MSYERDRVSKCIDRARRASKRLAGFNDPQRQQDEWEAFLEDWKKGLERMRSYALKHDLKAKHDAIHSERVADPILNYAWEARNVEAHEIDGGSRLTDGSISIGPAIPGGAVGIRNLSVINGVVTGTIESGRVTHVPPGIELGALLLKGGRRLEPPPGANARDVARHALAFADRHFAAVFRPD